MRAIIILFAVILIGIPAAVVQAHVPKVNEKSVHVGAGDNKAVISDYLSPDSVYDTIRSSNAHGECGAAWDWECGRSSMEIAPYEGPNGVSRVGSHSRDFKIAVREVQLGTGVYRWRTCVQRWYHKVFGETYNLSGDGTCIDGKYYFYNGPIPGGPA